MSINYTLAGDIYRKQPDVFPEQQTYLGNTSGIEKYLGPLGPIKDPAVPYTPGFSVDFPSFDFSPDVNVPDLTSYLDNINAAVSSTLGEVKSTHEAVTSLDDKFSEGIARLDPTQITASFQQVGDQIDNVLGVPQAIIDAMQNTKINVDTSGFTEGLSDGIETAFDNSIAKLNNIDLSLDTGGLQNAFDEGVAKLNNIDLNLDTSGLQNAFDEGVAKLNNVDLNVGVDGLQNVFGEGADALEAAATSIQSGIVSGANEANQLILDAFRTGSSNVEAGIQNAFDAASQGMENVIDGTTKAWDAIYENIENASEKVQRETVELITKAQEKAIEMIDKAVEGLEDALKEQFPSLFSAFDYVLPVGIGIGVFTLFALYKMIF
jgi:hypothetical protein